MIRMVMAALCIVVLVDMVVMISEVLEICGYLVLQYMLCFAWVSGFSLCMSSDGELRRGGARC